MKSLQSDRSNFAHRKGVKILTFEKFLPKVQIYPPKCTHVPIYITIGPTDFPGLCRHFANSALRLCYFQLMLLIVYCLSLLEIFEFEKW